MYLLEHDAKELLAYHGIPSPAGCWIESAASAGPELPPGPWIVKAQVAVGGRGKAGGIRAAATREELAAQLDALLGSTLRNQRVSACRIEQAVTGARETYLSLMISPGDAGVRLMMAARGGIEIEAMPEEAIQRLVAPPELGALTAAVDALADRMPGEVVQPLREAGHALAEFFLAREAMLAEVNPLFILPGGRWTAGDAKVITDDNALHRQPALQALLERRVDHYAEARLKLQHGFDYVVVDADGEIGLLTTGAGLSMMLIDELRAEGLKPYNFLDIRTGGLRGDAARLIDVLRWIAAGPRVRVVLVNIFAGITDLGEFARLLIEALRAVPELTAPVVARLTGTRVEAAREALAASGIALHTELEPALAQVRRLLQENRRP